MQCHAHPALLLLAIDPTVLSLLVLIACLLCIYMVFFFGRRLQNSAYIRDSLVESATQQELRALVRELDDRALQGALDPNNPPPDGYGSTRRLWQAEKYASASELSWSPPNETDAQRAERLEREQKRKTFDEACRKWENEEKLRYNAEKERLERTAYERAKKKVPTSFDISLLGGGYSFLLEFSTVIVIIFTLLILGILNIMQGKDISTILASIAGYVLGKATSESRKSPTAEPGGARPEAVKMMQPPASFDRKPEV
jgi:hypothetical protein